MFHSPSYISSGSGFGRRARHVSELSLRRVLNALDVVSRRWTLITSSIFQLSVIHDVYFALCSSQHFSQQCRITEDIKQDYKQVKQKLKMFLANKNIYPHFKVMLMHAHACLARLSRFLQQKLAIWWMKLFPLTRLMHGTENNSGVLLLELNPIYSFAYMNKV